MKTNLKVKKGNLIDYFNQYEYSVAHGCNCEKTMGAGVAKLIKENYPPLYQVDQQDPRYFISRLGDYTHVYDIKHRTTHFNLYTQLRPGKNLDLEALTLCMRKMNIVLYDNKIVLPKIGCGIAGGNWDTVRKILEKELFNLKEVLVLEYEVSK